MITITDLSLNFSGEPLFKDVNLKFTEGNCYGVIGANGAGKSTFLRILSGDLDPSTGTVSIAAKTRMSVLKQDHFAFNEESVLNTVLLLYCDVESMRGKADHGNPERHESIAFR